MLDLQKAFDTVDHKILTKKLKSMGILSTEWFESYLHDRKQSVSVNGVESDPLTVKCGVPQGSILGPLLFLCYINDMQISVNCKLMLYADDSALLISGKFPSVIAQNLTEELNSCYQWLVDNKLSLHLGKTETMLLGSKKKLKKVQNFSVSCNNTEIEQTKKVTYLGAILDNTLSGESIVNSIIKKANSRLKFLYRQASSLNQNSRKTLATALIQCHFDYSCSSWYSGLNKNLKGKLQIMQNKIVRFILNKGPREHIGQEELDNIGFLKVEDRVKQLKLNHVYKINSNTAPFYMHKHFNKISDRHNYNTRHQTNNYFLPRVHKIENTSFYFTAIKEWNSLPTSIKTSTSIATFKIQVKKHLAQEARREETNSYHLY